MRGKVNSKDFDCYLENIWRELPEDKKSLFLCLDSMWFSSYATKVFKPEVLRWIKNKDIFSKKYVFVPIVLWGHWCLLIFCHLGKTLESDSSTPCMLLLDSLHMIDPLRFEPKIRKFVSDIFKTEERPESQKLIKKIKLLVPKVPQQRNDTTAMKENWFTPDQLESFWKKLQTETKDSPESEDTKDSAFSDSGDVIVLGIEKENTNDSAFSDGSFSDSEDIIFCGIEKENKKGI